jgi:hypothetical protein
LYTTFFAPDKETAQQFQGAKNVPEENRTKAVGRLRFSVGRAAYWRRSVYKPVMRSTTVLHYFYLIIIIL